MINSVETLPGVVAAEVGDPKHTAGMQIASSLTVAASDSVAFGQAASFALADVPYPVAGRTSVASSSARAFESENDAACTARFGPQYALIRAALPSAMQQQFDAQLTAAYDPSRADGAAQEGKDTTAFSQSDLAKLVQRGVRSEDDGASSVLVSRLARDVAQFGPEAVAQALHLAYERIAFASVASTSPDAFAEAGVIRREDERKQQRHERRPDPDERERPSARDDGSDHAIHDERNLT